METRLAAGSIENAQLWLAKLKKNEEKVGIEVLQTQYRRGYMALLERTREAVEEAASAYIKVAVHNVQDLIGNADTFIERERRSGLFTKAWNRAYQDKDLNGVFEIILPAFLRLQHEIYQPYWLSHVKIIDGHYYNDLIDAYWIDTQGSDGYWKNDRFSTMGLPPTSELCEKQMEQLLVAA